MTSLFPFTSFYPHELLFLPQNFLRFTKEADSLYFRDFNAEPELMPKTPSQKKNSRRKRVSLGRQEENQARRRFGVLITFSINAEFSYLFNLSHFKQ